MTFIWRVVVLLCIASTCLAQTIPATGAVAAGASHALAIRSDGSIWSWGVNTNGQLGDGTTAQRATPLAVSSLVNVAQASAGASHSIAVLTDGTVRGWGLNTNGQIGDGTTTQRTAPVTISSLSNITAVAAGTAFSLALKSDGTVWSWGLNTNGQCGNGTTTQGLAPAQIAGLSNVIAIAAGASHALALKSDGSVWSWGLNTNGQLGNGTTTQSLTPVQITTLNSVSAIAAGASHSLALRSDGTVRAWGLNTNGRLGDGTTTQRTTPVTVSILANVTGIRAGSAHSLAIKNDGTAWAWGLNSSGQLGDGTVTQRTVPTIVPSVTNAISAAGGSAFTLILKNDGSIACFGANGNGQFGDGVATTVRLLPIQPTQWLDLLGASAGTSHSLAVRTGGTAWAWGLNSNGQLGDGTTAQRSTPVQVSTLSNVAKVSAGAAHSLALLADGTVRGWGLNTNGQVGDGTTTQRTAPVAISSLTNVTAVATGISFSLALKSDGTVWSWGLNTNGQLGNGTTTQGSVPAQITSLSSVIAIAAGTSHGLALKTDGTVWSWGLNTNGQLGNGTTTQSLIPVQVTTLSSITAIAAGASHSLALRTDGTLRAWGLNTNGRLGDGTTTQRTSPVAVSILTNVTAIRAGAAHSLAIKNDGTAWAWGLNSSGQLGDGTTTQRTVPTAISSLSAVSLIVGGGTHSLAGLSDGTIRSWGSHSSGQLAAPILVRSATALCLIASAADTDADGLPDSWELAQCGHLTANGGSDADKDGLTNVQEFVLGTNPQLPDADQDKLTDPVDAYPSDFYNNVTPLLTIVGGNNQVGVANAFNALPFDIAVWSPNGPTPLANAPVTFSVATGGGQLAEQNNGSGPLASSFSGRSDVDGTFQSFYKQPSIVGANSSISATAGAATLTLSTTSMGAPSADDDGDGLINSDEMLYGTNYLNPDTDSDGIRDGEEVSLGLDPLVQDLDNLPGKISGLKLLLRANSIALPGGSSVSSWTDSSGFGYNAVQASGPSQPIIVANSLNGRPVVRFDGNDYLDLPNALTGASAGEVFILLKSSPIGSYGYGLANMGAASYGMAYWPPSLYDDFGSTERSSTGQPGVDLTQFHLYNASSAPGLWVSRFNGTVHFQRTTNTVGFPSTMRIGQEDSYVHLNGDIAEVIAYNRVLTASERESLMRYFAVKYSLASTPAVVTGVRATVMSSSQIALDWRVAASVPFGGILYEIERKSGSGPFVKIAESTSGDFVDTDLNAESTYVYRIRARGLSQTGDFSLEVSAATLNEAFNTVPLAPARLWLKADVVQELGGNSVSKWPDVSGRDNHATQAISGQRPILIENAINGRSVVRFDGSNDFFDLPNLMNAAPAATSGEIFTVMRMPEGLTRNHGLWMLGRSGSYGGRYFGDRYHEDFGRTTDLDHVLGAPRIDITQYHLHNVSASMGEWLHLMNGSLSASLPNPGVEFRSDPRVGRDSGSYLKGDIAELIIYDRKLSASEREAVGRYLAIKYAFVPPPSTPANLTASVISNTQINLAWSASSRTDLVVYEIERKQGQGAYIKVAEVSNALGYLDSELESGISYDYRVRARGLVALSGYSNEASAITLAEESIVPMPFGGIRLWLKGEAVIVADGGMISMWPDTSGRSNHATQGVSGQRPMLVENAINGRAVVRFDGSNDFFDLPNLMNAAPAATSGEIFAVMRMPEGLTRNHGLWMLGRAGSYGGRYFGGRYHEDFGRTTDLDHVLGATSIDITQYHLHNVSASLGEWLHLMNGSLSARLTNPGVEFRSDPRLGRDSGSYLKGDVAELIIYDRKLSASEREAVGRYLAIKYALVPEPSALANLTASVISSTQVNLVWSSPSRADHVVYEIERKQGQGPYVKVAEVSNALGYLDSGLESGASYTYRVRARGLVAWTGHSNEASATTLAAESMVPMPIDGMRLWLKADAVNVADAGMISTWPDLSGKGNHATQGISGQRPMLVQNAINGRSVVRFDGTDDFFNLPNLMNAAPAATSGEIFAVMRMPEGLTRNHGLWMLGRSGSYGGRYFGGRYHEDFGRTTDLDHVLGATSIDITQYHLHNVSASLGEWLHLMNGSLSASLPNPGVEFRSDPRVGRDSGSFLKGDIAELIIYDRKLTPPEREAVGYYLAQKYNITSLLAFGYYRDSNSDGVTDAVSGRIGIDPYVIDTDGDGVANLVERKLGTDPLAADTDGDGASDAIDAFPLDPSRSAVPVGTPGDTTPPDISLTLPTNAVQLP